MPTAQLCKLNCFILVAHKHLPPQKIRRAKLQRRNWLAMARVHAHCTAMTDSLNMYSVAVDTYTLTQRQFHTPTAILCPCTGIYMYSCVRVCVYIRVVPHFGHYWTQADTHTHTEFKVRYEFMSIYKVSASLLIYSEKFWNLDPARQDTLKLQFNIGIYNNFV